MATKFITIGIEIMHDKNLNANEKFIYAEIHQLSTLEDGCHAKNKHFSELIGISTKTVSLAIKKLSENGYITTEIINGTRNHKRVIKPLQNVKPPFTKCKETKGNITYTDVSTNTSVNNKELEEQEQEHSQLWSDYSLGFLKRKGRSSSEIGSKAKSLARYIKLCKKGVSYSDIREVVNKEAGKSFGNKHLENILSPTYFKDNYNGV